MKEEKIAGAVAAIGKADHSKLLSLLALATSAVAMPQTSSADIIYTDLSSNPPVVGPNSDAAFLITLPGTARLNFRAGTHPTAISSSRFVIASQAGGYLRIKTAGSFVIANTANVVWGSIVGGAYHSGTVGKWNYNAFRPNNYNNKYLAFEFRDSTQGNAMRFGWALISLSRVNDGIGPDVTISGVAYDNTGAQIPMGAVPEPGSMALLVLGALTLGAKGLRAWRTRTQPVPS